MSLRIIPIQEVRFVKGAGRMNFMTATTLTMKDFLLNGISQFHTSTIKSNGVSTDGLSETPNALYTLNVAVVGLVPYSE